MFRALFSSCTDLIQKYAPDAIKADDDEEEDEMQKGQDHLFTFYEELDDKERRELDTDYDGMDIEAAEEAFEFSMDQLEVSLKGVNVDGPRLLNWELKRPPQMEAGANVTRYVDVGEGKLRSWRTGGLELYNKQRVACIIMSGGLDSRMSVNGLPKGVLDLGLLSHKSIFQLYTERIRRVQHLAHRKFKRVVNVPLYIMCNRQNREAIEDFYRDNNYFGIREQDVTFFTQSYMPVLNNKGKILLGEKHRVQQQPNGNGGLFKALVEEGMISDMKSRGVTTLYACSVDNVLAKVGDPLMLGYCEACKSEVGLKCIERLLPEEEYGVFCSQRRLVATDIDGDGKADILMAKVRPRVIEMFELPEESKKRRQKAIGTETPPLVLHSGNLSQYYFKVDFVMKTYAQCMKRWHVIQKNVEYVDLSTGDKVRPPIYVKNARRLEMFVFDCLEQASKVCALEVPRTEMALVKKMTGPESPQAALSAVGKLHQQWIHDAGGFFQEARIASDRDDCKVEVSPLVSYEGEDLFGQFPNAIRLPFYLPSYQELLHFSAATASETRRPSTHYLDWESDLGQHELEAELQGQLGFVMKMMEDTDAREYIGERATDEEECLPPTPRLGEDMMSKDMLKRVRGRGGEDGDGGGDHIVDVGQPTIAGVAEDKAERKASKEDARKASKEGARQASKETAAKDEAEAITDGGGEATVAKKEGGKPEKPIKIKPSDILDHKRKEFWGGPDAAGPPAEEEE